MFRLLKERPVASTLWILLFLVAFWSLWKPPAGYFIWSLEAGPIVGVAVVLLFTRRCFPLTPLAYGLIAVHGMILLVGAHYTYAEVPLFNWLRDTLELSRNHYDRVGHLAQGFVPAIIVREILLRRSPLGPGGWLFVLTTAVCLSFSALYEMFEWWTALLVSSDAGDAFLGTQGDVWDTQTDMFLALIGAMAAQLLLGSLHDRELRRLATDEPPAGRCDIRPAGD